MSCHLYFTPFSITYSGINTSNITITGDNETPKLVQGDDSGHPEQTNSHPELVSGSIDETLNQVQGDDSDNSCGGRNLVFRKST